ncbi:MAG: 50S ribosomal protein L31 [Candidatus Beckwithbacteria bacterium]|nr:50S ribosomal protein L31 [Patescibacteria group bacterium]
MKKKIHPKYYSNCKVTCACGNVFTTGSTLEEIKVDICSACHPFFTGKMKFIDTMGRVEKFQKSQKKAEKKKYTKKIDRKRLEEKLEKAKPRTLKEMIEQQAKKKKKQ